MKVKLLSAVIILGAVTLFFFSCAEPQEETVVLFVTASLGDVIAELVDSFTTHTEVLIKTNLASSGTLARQMAQGNVPDIYISASKEWMEYVDSLGLLMDNIVKELANNTLVLIAPKGSDHEPVVIDSTVQLATMLGRSRLSMGDPAHVPAGKYAKQAIQFLGWHSAVASRILPAKDVRSALMMVEMGESPLGIVYRTDAEKSQRVKILGSFPTQTHQPIVYMAAMCSNSEKGRMFLSYIEGEQADSVWLKYGFSKSR